MPGSSPRDGSSIASRMLVGIPPALPIGRVGPIPLRLSDSATGRRAGQRRFPTRLDRLISAPRGAAPAKATQVTRRASAEPSALGHRTVHGAQEHRPEDRDTDGQAELSRCHRNSAGVRRVPLPYGRQHPREQGTVSEAGPKAALKAAIPPPVREAGS